MKSTDRRQRSVVADMPLAVSTMSARISPRHAATWMLTGCGLWLVALRLYFIFLRSPLLPEDTRFMGSSLAQVRSGLPGLEGWLQRVFTVMGGFIAGTGVLTVFIAWSAIPSGLKGTSLVIALAGR